VLESFHDISLFPPSEPFFGLVTQVTGSYAWAFLPAPARTKCGPFPPFLSLTRLAMFFLRLSCIPRFWNSYSPPPPFPLEDHDDGHYSPLSPFALAFVGSFLFFPCPVVRSTREALWTSPPPRRHFTDPSMDMKPLRGGQKDAPVYLSHKRSFFLSSAVRIRPFPGLSRSH